MPSIAQQDYIVIDWEGATITNISEELLAEIKAQLRAIRNANPLTLLSVVFKNYDSFGKNFDRVISVSGPIISFYSGSEEEFLTFNFQA